MLMSLLMPPLFACLCWLSTNLDEGTKLTSEVWTQVIDSCPGDFGVHFRLAKHYIVDVADTQVVDAIAEKVKGYEPLSGPNVDFAKKLEAAKEKLNADHVVDTLIADDEKLALESEKAEEIRSTIHDLIGGVTDDDQDTLQMWCLSALHEWTYVDLDSNFFNLLEATFDHALLGPLLQLMWRFKDKFRVRTKESISTASNAQYNQKPKIDMVFE